MTATSSRRRFTAVAAVEAILVCWATAWLAASGLEVQVPLSHADAVVIMAGSSAYEERSDTAAALFLAHRAPLVALTDEGTRAGWSDREQRNPSFAELTVRRLVARGVPSTAVVVLPVPPYDAPTGTGGEAEGLRDWVRTAGLRSLLLVTSHYHTRRAVWTVRRAMGPDVVVGVEPATRGSGYGRALWWVSARGWRTVAGEYVKWAYEAIAASEGAVAGTWSHRSQIARTGREAY